MIVTDSVLLGSFTVGEVPPSLEYQFLDSTGVPISLVGFGVARFQWATYAGSTIAEGPFLDTATITDAVNGRVTHAWDGDEFAATGRHRGQFFVNDGATQYASIVIEWNVCASIGAPPTV